MSDNGRRHTNAKHQSSEGKCPICRAAVTAAMDYFPFCSKRCKQIDLGKWLGGDYQISRPVEERDLDEG